MEGPDLRARGLAVEEEVEELEADRVALDIESFGGLWLALQVQIEYLGSLQKALPRHIMNYRTSFPDLECQSHAFVHS